MRPVAHQVRSIRDMTPADLVASPGSCRLLSDKQRYFVAWDVLRPNRTIECAGFNERQAIDDAVLKLSIPMWRVRLRPSVPSDRLNSRELA